MMPIAIRMIPTIPAGFTNAGALERAPSGDQVHDQDDDRHDEEQMDERPDVNHGETEQPENQQNDEDSPKHMFSFEWVYFSSRVKVQLRLKIFGNSKEA